MLTVVIATRNRAPSLRRTLESLARMIPPDDGWEIVVVDNSSSDCTPDAVAAFAATAPMAVQYVLEPNAGKSFAVNAGIAIARGDLLAFTDDDVVVDPGWGRALVVAVQRTGWIGAGGRIVAEWTSPPPRWMTVEGPGRLMSIVAFDAGEEPAELGAPPFGPNMAFRKVAFERYGLFRTDLGPGPGRYLPGQDTEFGRRLRRSGERLAWAPDAIVRHELQAHKITKRYIASWYFRYGRMMVRTGMLQLRDSRWFGVPPILFQRFMSNIGWWSICPDPKRRFRYWAETNRVAGAITEAVVARTRQ